MRNTALFALAVLMPACIETNLNPKDDVTGEPIVDSAPPDCPPQIPDCNDTAPPIDTQVIDTEVPDPPCSHREGGRHRHAGEFATGRWAFRHFGWIVLQLQGRSRNAETRDGDL